MALNIPLPPIDAFLQMIDVLAQRYGWSFSDITKEMYWEDVHEMYEYGCNLNVIEKSENMKFQFLLHAQTKDAMDKWRDIPIPYPDRAWSPPQPNKGEPTKFKPEFERNSKRAKMSPERRKRYEEVLEKVQKTQEKKQQLIKERYYNQYKK